MAEVQASNERVSAIASDASTSTIESLRARLLAERAASKEARLLAQKISGRVAELQSRLNAEIENRRKAQLAVADVLKALKSKGHSVEEVIASCSSLSLEKLEPNDIVAFLRDNEGTESERSSNENACDGDNTQDTADPVDPPALRAAHNHECPEQTHAPDHPVLHHDDGATPGIEDSAIAESHSGGDCQTMDVHEHRDLDHLNQITEGGKRLEGHSDDYEPETEQLVKDTAKRSPSPTSVDESSEIKELNVKCASDAGSTGDDNEKKDHSAATSSFSRHYEHINKVSGPQMPYVNGSTGFVPPDAYLGFYPIDGMSYNNAPRTAKDHKLHDLHAEAQAPFVHHAYYGVHGYFTSTKHPGIDADPPMFYRAPIIPGHESTVSLVDDKNGKLGDILTALRLARQQLTHKGYATTSFKDDMCDSSMSAAPTRKASAGYYTTGCVYQQQPVQDQGFDGKKETPVNPIVHLPPSPVSDQGTSAFERDDMFRGGTDYYTMAGFDSYLQPKGEVHLGNGITLYTD